MLTTSGRLTRALLITALGMVGDTGATTEQVPGNPTRWTVDDIVFVEEVSGLTISLDGHQAAWLQSSVVKIQGKERAIRNLYTSPLDEPRTVQLTRGIQSMAAPAFSPDSRRIAFVCDRALPDASEKDQLGKKQVWVIPVDGGEAFPATRLDRDVRSFSWEGNASLLVVAAESPARWEMLAKEAEDKSIMVEDVRKEPRSRLFRVGVESGEVERLGVNDDWINSVAVSPDARFAVITAQQSLSYEFDERVKPATFLLDLHSGTRTRLFEDGQLLPKAVKWAPDSGAFYFLNARSDHPQYRESAAYVNDLHCFDMTTRGCDTVTADWPRGLAVTAGLNWDAGAAYAPMRSGIVAALADGIRFRPARYERTQAAWTRTDLDGEHAPGIGGICAAPDTHAVVYFFSRAMIPPQLYVARLDGGHLGAPARLTDLNRRYADKPTGRLEVISWPGANDELIEGLLHYPLDWEPGRSAPLIVLPHGGPLGVSCDEWPTFFTPLVRLWEQRGAFVLRPNYHGSYGYGLEFAASIGDGNYLTVELADIERGVDRLIQNGLADPNRLAVVGYSNGAVLGGELIARSSRWKAAVLGAGVYEMYSDWGYTQFGASFDNYYLGGEPWDQVDRYHARSMLLRVGHVATPTLLVHGTADRTCGVNQSWALFRALQQLERAPIRLVLFPDEDHLFAAVAHKRRLLQETLTWLDQYLFGETPVDEVVPKEAPLAGLLASRRVASVRGLFGVQQDSVLTPEFAVFEGMTIARFEITRAQMAAFVPSDAVAAVSENLPATGVSFQQARAYAAWLGQKLGRPVRLPTETEARRLAKAAGTGGNTLDRWVGYSVNPDDAAVVHKLLATLPDRALLLKPVGSQAGAGDDPVFDLDGNAAEWATREDGSGVAVGPCAVLPVDARQTTIEPGPEYVGFRVVLERAERPAEGK